MKREVVQDFLNLPGIKGVALMYGRTRPYFCGVDQVLNFQQKEALAQGIQQVIETTPAGFRFFEFQFNGHQLYIYKLERGIILLVLAADALSYAAYAEKVERLKAELQEDVADAIATFRGLAGTITRPQDHWRQPAEPLPVVPPAVPVLLAVPDPPAVSLRDLLIALNRLSYFTSQYLGATIVANYWKAARPDQEWLNQFQIDRAAHITWKDASSDLIATDLISIEQHQWVQTWVKAFIDRCSKVLRDFAKTVRRKALEIDQQSLLWADLP